MATLTPWALSEPAVPTPADPEERALLFADAPLALMYSGNFGRAHSFQEILELARGLRRDDVRLVFSVRGNREQALRDAVKSDDTNISFCGFAPPDRLEQRLSAADIHVVSLRPEWTGMVVPSKFFGAIAAGRPVLFAGSPDSAVAWWIESYGLGWVLTPDNIPEVTEQIRSVARSPQQMLKLHKHCFDVYHRHFSRDRVIEGVDHELRVLLIPSEVTASALAQIGLRDCACEHP
jgi:colanic acid biosynthesis glycosyl transferase WcaI